MFSDVARLEPVARAVQGKQQSTDVLRAFWLPTGALPMGEKTGK
jgi:hypothetical protein